MNHYHIFQMKDAQHGLGIAADTSKATKKLGRQAALFSGTIDECLLKKTTFINQPKLVDNILLEREKQLQKGINKLIKKHK